MGSELNESKTQLISEIDDNRSVVEDIVSLNEPVAAQPREIFRLPQLHRTACLIRDVCMPGIRPSLWVSPQALCK